MLIFRLLLAASTVNHSLNLFKFQKCTPLSKRFPAVPQEWNDALAVQRACGENAGLLKTAMSCRCVCLSVHLVITLKGVQAGFEAQGTGVGEVGGSVQVQARQDLHISDSGRMELQQVFNPL